MEHHKDELFNLSRISTGEPGGQLTKEMAVCYIQGVSKKYPNT
jgi:hypothetical protein